MIIPSDTNSTRVLHLVILSVLEHNTDKRDGGTDVDPMSLRKEPRGRQTTKSEAFWAFLRLRLVEYTVRRYIAPSLIVISIT